MAREGKSRRDIVRQFNRLYAAWEAGEISDERMARVQDATDRYLDNIQNMKRSRNAFQKDVRDRLMNGEASFSRTRANNNIKVSRNTYMGLSKG